MGVAFNDMDFNLVLKDLGKACLTTDYCGECLKNECLVGYAKDCIMSCVQNNVTYVENGFENIPLGDIKDFDKEVLITGIADILHLCASCKENHFNNCIVNIIRSCYELDLFGDVQEYNGSAVEYIIKLNHTDYKKAIASRIVDEYHKVDYIKSKNN